MDTSPSHRSAGPKFEKTEHWNQIVDEKGSAVLPEIHCRIERGFSKTRPSCYWSKDRDDLFTASCAYSLSPSVESKPLFLVLGEEKGSEDGTESEKEEDDKNDEDPEPPRQIQALVISLSAHVDDKSHENVRLFFNNWLTVPLWPIADASSFESGLQDLQSHPQPCLPLQQDVLLTAGLRPSPFGNMPALGVNPAGRLPLLGQARSFPGPQAAGCKRSFGGVLLGSADSEPSDLRFNERYYKLSFELWARVPTGGPFGQPWIKVALRSSERLAVRDQMRLPPPPPPVPLDPFGGPTCPSLGLIVPPPPDPLPVPPPVDLPSQPSKVIVPPPPPSFPMGARACGPVSPPFGIPPPPSVPPFPPFAGLPGPPPGKMPSIEEILKNMPSPPPPSGPISMPFVPPPPYKPNNLPSRASFQHLPCRFIPSCNGSNFPGPTGPPPAPRRTLPLPPPGGMPAIEDILKDLPPQRRSSSPPTPIPIPSPPPMVPAPPFGPLPPEASRLPSLDGILKQLDRPPRSPSVISIESNSDASLLARDPEKAMHELDYGSIQRSPRSRQDCIDDFDRDVRSRNGGVCFWILIVTLIVVSLWILWVFAYAAYLGV